MHFHGPYNNLCDKKVLQFIGSPLLQCILSTKLCSESVNSDSTQLVAMSGHQESWSPVSDESNKTDIMFDKNLGFVIDQSALSHLPCELPLDMNDSSAYRRAVDLILASVIPIIRQQGFLYLLALTGTIYMIKSKIIMTKSYLIILNFILNLIILNLINFILTHVLSARLQY